MKSKSAAEEAANRMVSSHSAIVSETPVTDTVPVALSCPVLMVRSMAEGEAVKSEAAAVPPEAPTVTRTGRFAVRALEVASKATVTLAVSAVPLSVKTRASSLGLVTVTVTPRSSSARVIRAGSTETPGAVPTTPTVR